jgi:hypothetical protein
MAAAAAAGAGVYPVYRAAIDSSSCWSTMDGVYLGRFVRRERHPLTGWTIFNAAPSPDDRVAHRSSTYVFENGRVYVYGETLPSNSGLRRPPIPQIRKVECPEPTYDDFRRLGFSNKDARLIMGIPLTGMQRRAHILKLAPPEYSSLGNASDDAVPAAAAIAEPEAAVAAEPPKVTIQEQTYIADWKKRPSGAWVLQCPKCGGAGTSAKPEVIKHKPECIYDSKLLKFKAVPSGPKPTNGGKRTRRRRRR